MPKVLQRWFTLELIYMEFRNGRYGSSGRVEAIEQTLRN